jgi:hypothetical protein
MNKKTLLFAWVLSVSFLLAKADEGMWIPSLIGKNYNDMQRAGIKLSAQDIYDINHASVKDAIVSLGGFCTAEIVSKEGLLFTNHHCAFDAIQSQSSAQNNYLENGYWANEKSQELTTAAYAAILDHITDITDKVLPAVAGLNEQARRSMVKRITDSLSKAEKTDKSKLVTVAEFFNGNQYFIFVYDKYPDVRLVAAPPSSIGKFGGDTDNWMWPRHTGDFSVMRIYAGPDNKPAPYSPNNKPFVPKHHLPISLKGVQNNDFAMIMGFPGRTQRYEFSREIDMAQNVANPIWIEYWKMMTETMKSDMDKDININIKLASVYAQKMNYYKYAIGQTAQLKRLRTVESLQKREASLRNWIASDPKRVEEYGQLFDNMNKAYDDFKSYEKYRAIIRFGFTRDQLMGFLLGVYGIGYEMAANNPKATDEDIRKALEPMKEAGADFYKDYNATTEKKILAKMLVMCYTDIPADQRAAELTGLFANASDKEALAAKYIDKMFKKSLLANDTTSLNKFLAKASRKSLLNDPFMKMMDMVYGHYRRIIFPKSLNEQTQIALLKRSFFKAMLEMNPDKSYYPDANSTERLTFGNVKEYDGLDAVHYNYFTTSEGILEKEDNTNEEFKVSPKQHDLLMNKSFGKYADKNSGKLPVCFLTTNDITGGNSGSPVMNADGEQIGIAFDGNWEAMSGDIDFSGDQKRTICVDIRYVLWCIDKVGNASNIIRELDIKE